MLSDINLTLQVKEEKVAKIGEVANQVSYIGGGCLFSDFYSIN